MKNSQVEITCKFCNTIFSVEYKHRKKVFCNRKCMNLYYRGENSTSFGKTYRTKETHPEWAKKVSDTHKLRRTLVDNNPMKNPDIAKKASETRKKLLQDPAKRKIIADAMRKAWADGKFANVNVGKCKWFSFTKRNGEICKVQGKWELAYAKWLDENHINFKTHIGRFQYAFDDGTIRNYYPDFYLVDDDRYVEIKNAYHHSINKNKIDAVRSMNPNVRIDLLFKDDLVELGVFNDNKEKN